MDFSWTAELVALRDEVTAVAEEAVADRVIREEAWVAQPDREFSLELGRRGWLGMTWPTGYGGGGRDVLERLVVTETLIATGAPIARTWVGDRQIGPTLLAFGTEQQRRQYLPAMISGEACWSIGMSEPDAGSDLANISTRATRDGDRYIVEGRKIWTSFAAEASHIYLIARTDPESSRHRGLSEFTVDMTLPGITVSPIGDMTGDAHFCEVTFDEVEVPASDLVGEPGAAFGQVMQQLQHERAGIDRLVSNRALYLQARRDADSHDPLVRQEIAAIESAFLPARLMVIRETLGQGRGTAAVTKVLCTELEQRVANFVGRVYGPAAMEWGRYARAICYAPAYSIQGGMNTVLRNVIGERTLGLPKEPQ
jgi:alkylation response protein AidB-like acyl-CoA dehydrogenase